MTDALLLECESVRETFREWHAEHESLDAQLAESLTALAAYQSHLDAWQQQLARERDVLRESWEEFESDRAAAAESRAALEKSSAEANLEMSTAREKIADLSANLLARTEELRTLDQSRSELAAELELTRVREKELKFALDEQKRTLETERAQLAEELRHVREDVERRAEVAPSEQPRPPAKSNKAGQLDENPLLGSIVQQFGKLRQQRAIDREALRKAR